MIGPGVVVLLAGLLAAAGLFAAAVELGERRRRRRGEDAAHEDWAAALNRDVRAERDVRGWPALISGGQAR